MALVGRFRSSGSVLIEGYFVGPSIFCTSVGHFCCVSYFLPLLWCRWFQAGAGTTLFHVTKDPLDPTEFEETVNSNGDIVTGWGRSSTIEVCESSEQTCCTLAQVTMLLRMLASRVVRLTTSSSKRQQAFECSTEDTVPCQR